MRVKNTKLLDTLADELDVVKYLITEIEIPFRLNDITLDDLDSIREAEKKLYTIHTILSKLHKRGELEE